MGPVKIIATVGPASRSPETLRELARAGASVFRVNCSHASPEEARETVILIRETLPLAAVLLDLQGPKLRTGDRRLDLPEHRDVVLTSEDLTFDPQGVGMRPGDRMLVADGQIELRVLDVNAAGVRAAVLRGGVAEAHRGVNLPDTPLTLSALSEQDQSFITVANDEHVEWVALSFVRRAEDIEDLRARLRPGTGIVAKIERPEALVNLSGIVDAADAVMAARGDLGVEIPYEEVPRAQRMIAELALKAGKASICATEMLESMRSNTRPTRAEVSDVDAAVHDGYGAVMLSAETATGQHPVEAVRAMRRICDNAPQQHEAKLYADANPQEAAVSAAASALAMRTNAERILSLTLTGYSARVLSACRPPARILAATPNIEVARRLGLYWGVEPLIAARHETVKESLQEVRDVAARAGTPLDGLMVVTASRTNPARPPDTIWIAEPGIQA
jgi:pyruvate kinase